MTQATNPLSQSFFAKQVTNKNYLSPVGFKLKINKTIEIHVWSKFQHMWATFEHSMAI